MQIDREEHYLLKTTVYEEAQLGWVFLKEDSGDRGFGCKFSP